MLAYAFLYKETLNLSNFLIFLLLNLWNVKSSIFLFKDFQGYRGWNPWSRSRRNIFERSEKYPLCILAYLKRDRDIYAPNKSIKPLAKTSRRKRKIQTVEHL